MRKTIMPQVCSRRTACCLCQCLLLLAFLPVAAAQQKNDPVADAHAVFISGKARFTVLTPQLIRMEYSEDGKFEDHASLVFINRRLPIPKVSKSSLGKTMTLTTDKLTLTYTNSDAPFSAENLRVTFQLNGNRVTWTPGMKDTGNLGGTIRTLDGVRGSTPLDKGLLSRAGWVLIDDSEQLLFDNSDWPWVMQRPGRKRQDLYLFAYGHDYKQALHDFTLVAGRIPLPPRFAFGAWWSRYWAYTDTELTELVRDFQAHDIPLDVLVIDMDWHPTFGLRWWDNKKDQSGHQLGWTGYTWNKSYFPEPQQFLDWVHQQGLHVTLNMHPASGVQPHEEQYAEMARAMGIDPTTKQYVPFDIVNKTFAENYFKILHHPLERQGIDFFWLDWQQEDHTSLAGVNPTWWLNYTHFADLERRGKRPLLFHRFGGLGNHRYQIGFSGDTIAVWESLAFQPYFTATAANVGYGYWSHDIGGHMRALGGMPMVGMAQEPDYPELYTRWIQFGVFSPILRTHTTKDPQSERRLWAYAPEYASAMRDAYKLRYALQPYIYTAARAAYDSGISICHPLYYEYPEAALAYEFKDEYFFGSDMIVAPVTTAISDETRLATKTIWLPPGRWIEWFTGKELEGPVKLDRTFSLREVPVYVKAGSIIPMQPDMRFLGEKPIDPLILTVFPGESGETRVYDDAGSSPGYTQSQFSQTRVRYVRQADGTRKIEIFPIEGSFPGMPTVRGYQIRLPITLPPNSVRVNGAEVPFASAEVPGWRYEGTTLTTVISIASLPVSQKVEVLVKSPAAPRVTLDGVPGELARLRTAMDMMNNTWPKGWSPNILIDAAQAGRRMTLHPATALQELQKLQRNFPSIIEGIKKMDGDCGTQTRALRHLGRAASCILALKPETP